MKTLHATRLLAALFLAGAVWPALAASEPAQEDFSGKYLCVENADWSWALSHATVVKVGNREFLAGDEVPPPKGLQVKGFDAGKAAQGKAPGKDLDRESNKEGGADDAKGTHPKRHLPREGKRPHCRVLLPLDKVLDIRAFDAEADLNAYLDSIDDASLTDDEPTVF